MRRGFDDFLFFVVSLKMDIFYVDLKKFRRVVIKTGFVEKRKADLKYEVLKHDK